MKKIANEARRGGKPAGRARGTRTGRPVMVLLDLLGRRTALRVLWELHNKAPQTFRALQDAAETNPSVLNKRLAELRDFHIVAVCDAGYDLTSHGRALVAHLLPLHAWSESWAKAVGRASTP